MEGIQGKGKGKEGGKGKGMGRKAGPSFCLRLLP